MKERDNYIDFLRFVGITMIVLAHVNSPLAIAQIRCFDVPLMLFVSGLSFGGRVIPIIGNNFYWPRTKRILIPVYLFLSFYLIFVWLLGNDLSISFIVGSIFLSYNYGVQFVWIMRVFILVMLATPLLIKIEKHFSRYGFAVFLVLMIASLELFIGLKSNIKSEFWSILYEESLLWLLAYSTFFIIGLRLRFAANKESLFYMMLFTVCMVGALLYYVTIKGFPIIISPDYKYPPHSYYIIYGLWCSVLFWYLKPILKNVSTCKIVLFVGRNTIWIYLWHIITLLVMSRVTDIWYIKYIGTLSLSIVIVYFQTRFVAFLQSKTSFHIWKYLIG